MRGEKKKHTSSYKILACFIIQVVSNWIIFNSWNEFYFQNELIVFLPYIEPNMPPIYLYVRTTVL